MGHGMVQSAICSAQQQALTKHI